MARLYVNNFSPLRRGLRSGATFVSAVAAAGILSQFINSPRIFSALVSSLAATGIARALDTEAPFGDECGNLSDAGAQAISFFAAAMGLWGLVIIVPAARSFVCEPLVPWQFLIAIFGAFGMSWLSESVKTSSPARLGWVDNSSRILLDRAFLRLFLCTVVSSANRNAPVRWPTIHAGSCRRSRHASGCLRRSTHSSLDVVSTLPRPSGFPAEYTTLCTLLRTDVVTVDYAHHRLRRKILLSRGLFRCLAACRTRSRPCVRYVLCWRAFPLAPALRRLRCGQDRSVRRLLSYYGGVLTSRDRASSAAAPAGPPTSRPSEAAGQLFSLPQDRCHCGLQGRRLTRRSLADFAKLVELFDAHGVSFVSVTQKRRPAGAVRTPGARGPRHCARSSVAGGRRLGSSNHRRRTLRPETAAFGRSISGSRSPSSCLRRFAVDRAGAATSAKLYLVPARRRCCLAAPRRAA